MVFHQSLTRAADHFVQRTTAASASVGVHGQLAVTAPNSMELRKLLLRNQRKNLRPADEAHRQVHIQLRPIQVVRCWPFHGRQLLNGGLLESGKLIKRQQQFCIAQQQPKAMFGHIGDFSRRSGGSMHLEFPSGVTRPPTGLP